MHRHRYVSRKERHIHKHTKYVLYIHYLSIEATHWTGAYTEIGCRHQTESECNESLRSHIGTQINEEFMQMESKMKHNTAQ